MMKAFTLATTFVVMGLMVELHSMDPLCAGQRNGNNCTTIGPTVVPRNTTIKCNASFECGIGRICSEDGICKLKFDKGCGESEFSCNDGTCIPGMYVCNRYEDCKNGRDEKDCTRTAVFSTVTEKPDNSCESRSDCSIGRFCSRAKFCHYENPCLESQFTCENANGMCIANHLVCDGNEDCQDGQDERNCNSTSCSQFSCGNASCITNNDVCDGAKDCPNGEDEMDCANRTCAADMFKCRSGKCIPKAYICDDDNDCPDGQDELDCPNRSCTNDMFQCGNGTCIRKSYICDGDRDCLDGEDERDCHRHCQWDEFKCEDGKCIPDRIKCDAYKDCTAGEDEVNCGTTLNSNKCGAHQFMCKDGFCIAKRHTCDGNWDCSKGEDEENCVQGHLSTTTIVVVVCITFAVVACLGFFVWYKFGCPPWLRTARSEELMLQVNVHSTANNTTVNIVQIRKELQELGCLLDAKTFEINQQQSLGSGCFGNVYAGTVKGKMAAVKVINDQGDSKDALALLSEIKLLSKLEAHDNIVSFIGCWIDGGGEGSNIRLFLQLCPNGSLDTYLREHRSDFGLGLKEEHLIRWSYQVAVGMEYLTSKSVLHGDLAARNVLLDEALVAKISDFGLSRNLYSYNHYIKKGLVPLPWRWMSIEALRDMKFSPASDVWAYGVTLYEFFTLGSVPYPGLSYTTAFTDQLAIFNLRPGKPAYASDTIYETVIQPSWSELDVDRPKFSGIVDILRPLVESGSTTMGYCDIVSA